MEMPSISRPRALAYAAVALVLLIAGGRFLLPGGGGGDHAPAHGDAAGLVEAAPDEAPDLVVHVAGAVRRPGLYELPEGSRVDDAIARAGGATGKAQLDLLNLASPVADGQQVLVPARGKGGAAAAAGGGAAPGAAGGRVHLNTATLEELDALPGIGPVTAQKILDYREEKGAFQSVDELDAVAGIGPKRLETLRELVDL